MQDSKGGKTMNQAKQCARVRAMWRGAALALLLTTAGCATTAAPDYPARAFAAPQGMVPQVPVTDDVPHGMMTNVCHLTIYRAAFLGVWRTAWTGSAVVYRGRYLLTAGHNVLSRHSDVRKIEVRCGVRSAWARAGDTKQTIQPGSMMAASGFNGSGPFERDFAVIRLNQPISTAVPVELAQADSPAPGPLFLSGYPGGVHDGHSLFNTEGAMNRVEGDMLWYDIETHKSNSGGPVWRMRDGRAELLAIHVRAGGGGRIVNQGFRSEVERMISELDRRASE